MVMPASSNRFELGPVILAIGALLLIASLFTEWYEPELTAWNAFEWLDLLLAGVQKHEWAELHRVVL